MNTLFLIQLVTSFIVGGSIIALLSFMAERVNSRVAGIILAFPTTAALGFFFLGWAISPQTAASVVPATLIPLGLSMVFAAIYPYIGEWIAKYTTNRISQIGISYVLGIGLWLTAVIFIVVFELNNLIIGVVGYFSLIALAHFLLHRKKYEKPVTFTYTLSQKLGRTAFVGLILVLVVFLGKTVSPFWGGILAMFPAAFSSVIMILHYYYGPKSLFPIMRNVALGSLSLFAYAITVMVVFPFFGFIVGTLIAYAVSVAVTLMLIRFLR